MGYSPRGCKKLDATEHASSSVEGHYTVPLGSGLTHFLGAAVHCVLVFWQEETSKGCNNSNRGAKTEHGLLKVGLRHCR